MIIKRHNSEFDQGYTPITDTEGKFKDWMTDFGILRLEKGKTYKNQDGEKERVFLLMTGEIKISWKDSGPEQVAIVSRKSVLDDEPTALQVSKDTEVTIECLSDETEISVQGVKNSVKFPAKLWKPGDYRSERFGEGTLQDTSTRLVRTIFDAATAEQSQMVVGEVVNYPGKWSSYPPHDHDQPEIYHYRFFPKQGWGHAEKEDEVFKVTNGDTYTIPPGVTHSQCAAPGYAMYYIWIIPHLPNDKFGPDSRVFRKEHTWVMNPEAAIWPDESLEEVLKKQEEN